MLKFTKENGFYSENKRTKRALGSHKYYLILCSTSMLSILQSFKAHLKG